MLAKAVPVKGMLAGVLVMVMVAAGCAPPSPLPDGSIPQWGPFGANGLIVDGDQLWLADLFAQQLIRFDPDTGRITRRVGPSNGLTSPPGDVVQRVSPTGQVTVLATFAFGPNPIVRDPADASAVLVGDASSDPSAIFRVFTDGRPSELVVDGLPPINSFSFGPDGHLWAPAGGFASLIGSTGEIIRIDLATGAFEPVAVTFPGEPGKPGFNYAVAAKFGPDGQLYVLQGLDAAVYRIDPGTGVATRIANLPGGVGDNLAFTPEGRLYASTFVGGVVEILPGGGVRQVPLGSG